MGILAKLRYFTPQDTLCSIDNLFISSCPYYCTNNLGGANATILDPVSKSLKTAAVFEKQAACSRPLFTKLKSRALEDMYNIECAKFMFYTPKGRYEDFFSNYFQLSKDRHKMETPKKTSGKFSFRKTRAKHSFNFIATSGVKILINIAIDMQNSPTKNVFGKHYRQILLDKL